MSMKVLAEMEIQWCVCVCACVYSCFSCKVRTLYCPPFAKGHNLAGPHNDKGLLGLDLILGTR